MGKIFFVFLLLVIFTCSPVVTNAAEEKANSERFNFHSYTCQDLMKGLFVDIQQAGIEMVYLYLYYAGEIGQESVKLDYGSAKKTGQKLGELCAPMESRELKVIDVLREHKIGLPLVEED